MTTRVHRTHSPGFNAKQAPAAITGEKKLTKLAKFFDVHPHLIMDWKAKLQDGAAGIVVGWDRMGLVARQVEHAPSLNLIVTMKSGNPEYLTHQRAVAR